MRWFSFILLAIVVVVAFVLLRGDQQTTPAGVPVQIEFPGKVVYTTDVSQDPAPFVADCRERGGEFNQCGSVCEPGAEVCVQVCAFVCELP